MADDDKTVEISVTFPVEYLEKHLIPEYPAANQPSEAIRMAVANDVKRSQQMLTPANISDELFEALEQAGGGTFENVQRISVDESGNTDKESAQSISKGAK